jgi:hypothetical protein
VAGLAAAVPAFDVGAYNVPHDQLAVIHKNELVMTAQQGAAFRQVLSNATGSGGGGTSSNPVSLNIQAVDPRSFMAFMNNNGPEIARMISSLMTQNPSLRPAY